jgi:mannosyl-3-phosphoglycerate phosphatase
LTDLDGTLLDRDTYSYEESLPAIATAKEEGVPIVFCSSKTRAEQEALRSELGIDDPFIVEDGAALYVPSDYFGFDYEYGIFSDGYRVSEFAVPYSEVRKALSAVGSETGVEFRGYGDLSVKELAEITGLDQEAAERAKLREYQETIVSEIESGKVKTVERALAKRGLNMTSGGRFFGVTSSKGKGEAARVLIGLFKEQYPGVKTAGIGDGRNDVSLLSVVDFPFLVRKPGGRWEDMDISGLTRVPGVGPDGWRQTVLGLLKE